jgi:Type IV secretion system pilin
MTVFDTVAFDDLIRYALAAVVIAAALAAILYTIWGGFLMILSGGQEEKVKKAVNHIRHAGIGIVFLLLVLFILPLIAGFMWLAYGEYARPSAIFQTITEISGRVFGIDSQSDSVVPGSSSPLPSNFSDL